MLCLGRQCRCSGSSHAEKVKKAPGHFELKYHYQREMVEAKKIKFIKVGSKDNTADLMTKPVEVATFKQLYPKLKGIAAL